MYRAIVADDEAIIRRGIVKQIMSMELQIEVVGTASDGEETLKLVEKFAPEIVLVDINMPFMDGLTCIEKIRKINPNCIIIIISGYDKFEFAQKAISYNVDYYLLKPVEDDEFKEALENSIKKYCIRTSVASTMQNNELKKNNNVNILEYIKENFTKQYLSIECVERECNISRSGIFKILKSTIGKNFTDYVTQLRTEYAKELLLNENNYSIKEISDFVGYSDQHYFSRVFKSETNMTPKQYRDVYSK